MSKVYELYFTIKNPNSNNEEEVISSVLLKDSNYETIRQAIHLRLMPGSRSKMSFAQKEFCLNYLETIKNENYPEWDHTELIDNQDCTIWFREREVFEMFYGDIGWK